MKYELIDNFEVEDLGIQELDVYDIEVEDNHNFFGNDILLHNSAFFGVYEIIEKYEKEKQIKMDKIKKIEFCNYIEQKILQPVIQKAISDMCEEFNFFKNNLKMVKEKIADKVIYVKKKNYIMRIVDNGKILDKPELLFKGVKVIKTTTPDIIKQDVNDLVHRLFDIKNQDEFIELINVYKEKYKKMPIEDISIFTSLNEFNKYKPNLKNGYIIWKKSTPIHIRAAWLYNHLILKFNLQDKYDQFHEGNK